jgi:hypothetical protein
MKRKLKKSGKMRKCWKKNLWRDVYEGEGFAGSYLPDFQAPPLSLPALGGPSNPKGTFGQTFSYTLPAWAW